MTSFFEGAHDFDLNGGKFYDVKGDKNSYKVDNSVHITGDNIQTTISHDYSRHDNRSFHYGVNNYNGPTQNYTSGSQQYIHGSHPQIIGAQVPGFGQDRTNQLAHQWANMQIPEERERQQSAPPSTAPSAPSVPSYPHGSSRYTSDPSSSGSNSIPAPHVQNQFGAQHRYPPNPNHPHPPYPLHSPHPQSPPHSSPVPTESSASHTSLLDAFNSPSPLLSAPEAMQYKPPWTLQTDQLPPKPNQPSGLNSSPSPSPAPPAVPLDSRPTYSSAGSLGSGYGPSQQGAPPPDLLQNQFGAQHQHPDPSYPHPPYPFYSPHSQNFPHRPPVSTEWSTSHAPPLDSFNGPSPLLSQPEAMQYKPPWTLETDQLSGLNSSPSSSPVPSAVPLDTRPTHSSASSLGSMYGPSQQGVLDMFPIPPPHAAPSVPVNSSMGIFPTPAPMVPAPSFVTTPHTSPYPAIPVPIASTGFPFQVPTIIEPPSAVAIQPMAQFPAPSMAPSIPGYSSLSPVSSPPPLSSASSSSASSMSQELQFPGNTVVEVGGKKKKWTFGLLKKPKKPKAGGAKVK